MATLVIGEETALSAYGPSSAQRTAFLERRGRVRYPISLQVRYHTLLGRLRVDGLGHTVNISSSGLMIASPTGAPAGAKLEIRIEWPVDLDEGVPLQLVISGRVVRSEEDHFAVSIHSHEFHTLKRDS
jgi:c-di-GMP-binding flagellar brake protein YcgR